MVYIFKDSKRKADKDEIIFMEQFSKRFPEGTEWRDTDRQEDQYESKDKVVIFPDGTELHLQLKHDEKSIVTGNLFLELLSDKEKCTKGCIESCKVENMLYYNLEANEIYWFAQEKLWNFIETEGHRYQGRDVKNRGYTTYGIIVSKEDYSGGWSIHGKFPGEPFPESVDAIKKLKEADYIIGIYTTRPNELVEKWLDKYELTEYVDFINDNPHQPEGASHKPIAHAYIDDRAIRFDGTNMGEITEQIISGGFVPWQNQQ